MTPHRPARRTSIAILAVLATTSILAACGGDDDEPAATTEAATEAAPEASVEITGAWARTSPAVASAGAVYLTITNTGDVDDALISAAVDSSVAATAELHETVAATGEDGSSTTAMDGGMTTETTAMGTDTTAMGGGMMTMQPVDRIPVAAGESVALEPGGYHIMLLDLATPLEVGSTIDVTLTFEESGEQVVTVEVSDMAP